MAYDVFYFDRLGKRLPEFDSSTPEYDTPARNKMLRTSKEFAEAIQIDHPARPRWHWNGKTWVEGAFRAA